MRVLLTGSTGFVGSALSERLRTEGVDVISVGRTPDGIPLSEALSLSGLKVDGCIHLATLFLATHEEKDIPCLVDSNVTFGVRVLEAARKVGCKWFINAASFWQHASDGSPVNLYSATKEAFQTIASYYSAAYGIRLANLELTDTYGPEDRRRKLVRLWCENLNGSDPVPMSLGKQEIELVHRDDVTKAFLVLANLLDSNDHRISGEGETYYLPTNKRITVREAASVFEKATGGKLPILWGARPERQREVMHIEHRGMPLPGWTPEIDLFDGFSWLYGDFNREAGGH